MTEPRPDACRSGDDAPTDPRLRLRDEEELARQAVGLGILCDRLGGLGIPHLLSGGTLLGAARSGDFIPWDWDVEVSVRTEDLADRFDEVVADLADAGFAFEEVDRAPDNLKLVMDRDGTRFELQAYRLDGRLRTRRNYRTEERFFAEAATVVLRGRTYPCMGPIDEYLTGRYGDWRTPLRTSDKRAYLNPDYFRVPSWRRRLRSRLRGLRRRLARGGDR